MFSQFASITTQVRYLNLRLLPGGLRWSRTFAARMLEHRIGWHLYVSAIKAQRDRVSPIPAEKTRTLAQCG